MMRIGDFSKFGRVPVKTLRHYDEVGLLKPAQVDPFTNYRYYEFEQLSQLHRILALKELGFPLEEIRLILKDRVTPEQMRGMLKLRQAEIRQRILAENEQVVRVEARLRLMEQEDKMSQYEVVIRKVAPERVAAIRGGGTYANRPGPVMGRANGYNLPPGRTPTSRPMYDVVLG